MQYQLNRRTLLRGMGTALALPLLDAMIPLGAFAAPLAKGAAAPKRMAFLFVPNGVNMAEWTPSSVGALTGDLPFILDPFKNVRSSLNVLTGLTQKNAFALGDGGGDHARSASAWLTGCHPRKTSGANIKAGVSADQVAAIRLGKTTRFPSIELGCERGGLAGDCDSGYSCAYSNAISWRSESTPGAKEVDPRLVFERLFGGGDPNETAEARKLREETDRSILDFVMSDAKALSRSLGKQDQHKLDEYFTGIREIERRLQWTEKANSEAAAGKPLIAEPTGIPAEYEDHIRLMGDMMVLAFQTDQTRVATFMLANEGSNRSYRNIGIGEGHHELSHHGRAPEKLAKIRQINQFHAKQVAYVAERMKNIKEGSGTMLDNTFLIYGGGISDGDRHNHDDLPITLLGGQNMGVKGGQHVKYENGTPMTNLFLTMYDKMGIPADTIGTLGDSTGRLQVL